MTEHGKVVYLEIPCTDVRTSATFYQRVFDWRLREHGPDKISFDDATGGVSGTWRPGRPVQEDAGVLVYVNVDDVAASIEVVESAGGTVVQGIGGDPGEVTARFRDPHGNLLALYQEPTG